MRKAKFLTLAQGDIVSSIIDKKGDFNDEGKENTTGSWSKVHREVQWQKKVKENHKTSSNLISIYPRRGV